MCMKINPQWIFFPEKVYGYDTHTRAKSNRKGAAFKYLLILFEGVQQDLVPLLQGGRITIII